MLEEATLGWDWRQVRHALFGLQLRTTLLLTAIVLAATGLTGTMYLRIAARISLDEAKRNARELAKALSVAASEPVARDEREALLAIAQAMVPRGELVYLMFADMSGNVLGGHQKGAGQVGRFLSEDAQTISVQPLNRPKLRTGGSSGAAIDVVYPITAALKDPRDGPAPTIGYVRLGLSLAAADARLAETARRVVGLTVGITLLMVPLGYEVVRRVAGPINRLSDAAGRLAAGDLAVRVEADRRDEIGALSRRFNGMARDLARSHNQLVKLNAELEDRVLRRTEALKDANDQLRCEITEKRDLLRTVSHDLGAPLRNASGMAALLVRRQGDTLTPEAARCLTRIERNLDHGRDLIDELLTLSQIQNEQGVPTDVDTESEIVSIAGQFDFDLDQKDIRLVLDGPFPILHCRRRRFRQLMQNLIDNAIKYTDVSHHANGEQVKIVVAHSADAECHRFTVADQGIGVSPDEVEHIFHVFRRCAKPFVSGVPGKGVGLSCCKSIVQKMGGRIWVEPNSAGGSVFGFEIPRDAASSVVAVSGTADGRGSVEAESVL